MPVKPQTELDFKYGGAIQANSGEIYARRGTDDRVFDLLCQGKSGYVCAPKQTGKSSLAYSLHSRIAETGVRVAYVDLARIFDETESSDDDQFCIQFAAAFARALQINWRLGLVESEWSQLGETPRARLSAFIDEQLHHAQAAATVLFVDEMDVLAAMAKGNDAWIRAFSGILGQGLPGLSACLLGSVPPAWLKHLLRDDAPALAWVERLADFEPEEVERAFAPALMPAFGRMMKVDAVLDTVYDQTEGHPLFSQILLARAAAIGDCPKAQFRRALGDFIEHDIHGIRPHTVLHHADELMQASMYGVSATEKLSQYSALLGKHCLDVNHDDPVQDALYVTGLAAYRNLPGGVQLCLRNALFYELFDVAWLAKKRTRLRQSPGSDDEAEVADRDVVVLVDRVFCTDMADRKAPYQRKNSGRTFGLGHLHEFVLADINGHPLTLQIFTGLRGVGGQLWQQVSKVMVRAGAQQHPALPSIRDGGYNRREDFGFVISATTQESLSESDALNELRANPSLAVIQFLHLAEGLVQLHRNALIHRNLHPGSLRVIRNPATGDWHLQLARFELSELAADLVRSIDPAHRPANGGALDPEEVRQLCASSLVEMVCLAPERLAYLHGSEGLDMIEGPHSDVFGLGMVVCQWFIGQIEPTEAEDVFAGGIYVPEAHRALISRLEMRLRQTQVGDVLSELLICMIAFEWRNRETTYQVINRLRACFDTIHAQWGGLPTGNGYLLAYMSDFMVTLYRNWGLIEHGADSGAGEYQLRQLLERDLSRPLLLYSPQGSRSLERDRDDRYLRARYVLQGQEFSYFCNLYEDRSGSGTEIPHVLLILFSHSREKTRRLERKIQIRRSPGRLTIVPVDAVETEINNPGHYRDWSELLRTVVPAGIRHGNEGLTTYPWYLKVEQALKWMLELDWARHDARCYAVMVERNGLSLDLTLDEERDNRFVLSDAVRSHYCDPRHRRRPWLGDFFRDESEQCAYIALLEDKNGNPVFAPSPLVRFREKVAGDKIRVELKEAQRVPSRAWAMLQDDTFSRIQLARQEEACERLMEMPALIDQLGSPASTVHLLDDWEGVSTDLVGQAPQVIRQMLNAWPFFALHGPPGTGKTTVTARAIYHAIESDYLMRVLVSAQSHYALNNLAESVLKEFARRGKLDEVDPLRIASEHAISERKIEGLEAYTLDARAKARIRLVKKHCQAWLSAQIGGDIAERRQQRPIVERWLSTVDGVELEIRERVWRSSNLVFCTTGSATDRNLNRSADTRYDWVIIEEAAKAWPTELALPLVHANRWTLVGDHKQLPAFGKAEVERLLGEYEDVDEEEYDLREHGRRRDAYLEVFDLFWNLFRRLEKHANEKGKATPVNDQGLFDTPLARLDLQFRMRRPIAELVSASFYAKSPIKTDDDIVGKRPRPPGLPNWLRDQALVWIDTGGPETAMEDTSRERWSNSVELDVVKRLLAQMRDTPPNDIVILSPYKKQVERLRQVLPHLASRVYTVDSFQGRECKVVIISMVRCNQHKHEKDRIGFLDEPQRVNVLFSRARDLLLIVGSFSHFEASRPPVDDAKINWRAICARVEHYGKRLSAGELGLLDEDAAGRGDV